MKSIKAMLLTLSLGQGSTPALAPAQIVIHDKVDPSFPLVKNFEGWGASLCWWAKVCGGYRIYVGDNLIQR